MIASVHWGRGCDGYEVPTAARVEGIPSIQGQERAASEIKWEESPEGTPGGGCLAHMGGPLGEEALTSV